MGCKCVKFWSRSHTSLTEGEKSREQSKTSEATAQQVPEGSSSTGASTIESRGKRIRVRMRRSRSLDSGPDIPLKAIDAMERRKMMRLRHQRESRLRGRGGKSLPSFGLQEGSSVLATSPEHSQHPKHHKKKSEDSDEEDEPPQMTAVVEMHAEHATDSPLAQSQHSVSLYQHPDPDSISKAPEPI